MLDYCMCPKCERMIMLDSDFETGFCLYCGTHISYQDSREFLLERRGVSTVRVQNAQLGRRMVSQLLYRMENPAADFEEIQVIPRVILRGANQGDG